MTYLLKKENDKKELFSSNLELDGYEFKPKKKSKDLLKVSQIIVVDPNMINKILSTKFDKKFKDLIRLATSVINDEDADSSDTQIALDEVELVREILLNRYQKFLTQKQEELFVKRLRVIENQLRYKQILINQREMYYEYQQEKENGKSR